MKNLLLMSMLLTLPTFIMSMEPKKRVSDSSQIENAKRFKEWDVEYELQLTGDKIESAQQSLIRYYSELREYIAARQAMETDFCNTNACSMRIDRLDQKFNAVN